MMVENGARYCRIKVATFTVVDQWTYVPASIDNLLDDIVPSEMVCNFLNNLAGLSFEVVWSLLIVKALITHYFATLCHILNAGGCYGSLF